MENLIAVCGLDCKECEAFIATQKNDLEMKKEIADKWSKLFNTSLSPENINCVGCRVEGNHIGYCSMCEVRKCGFSKNMQSCALCNEYPECNTLNNFLNSAPEDGRTKIKSNLERIKAV